MRNEELNNQHDEVPSIDIPDIRRSAYFDKELSAKESAEIETALQSNAALCIQFKNYQKLDAAATAIPVPDMLSCVRTLHMADLASQTTERNPLFEKRLMNAAIQMPVPEISKTRYHSLWQTIEQRIVDAEHLPLWKKLDHAAAQLIVPELDEARGSTCFQKIAERIHLNEHVEAPQVTSEKWNSLWVKIQKQTSQKNVSATKIVQATEEFSQKQHSRWHPWRWASASILAASVLVAVLVSQVAPPKVEASVAMEIPIAVDEHYYVCAQYVESQPEPVVCFYLKKGNENE